MTIAFFEGNRRFFHLCGCRDLPPLSPSGDRGGGGGGPQAQRGPTRTGRHFSIFLLQDRKESVIMVSSVK